MMEWIICLFKGHDWMHTVCPVTFTPKKKICMRCLREDKPND